MVRRPSASLALLASLVVTACDLTDPLPPAVFVEPAALTIEDGQTAKLTARLRNPRQRNVIWSSLNRAIATVDVTGNVTGIANGTTTIVVKMVDDTTITATVPVTVSGPAVATINLTPTSAVVHVGFARQITAQLRAADGRIVRGRAITWTTPDAAIADVSAAGVVRGRAPGGPIALVASSEGRTANVMVRVAHAAEACPVRVPLSFGQAVDGRLALGDCEFFLDNSYVDVYEITLAAAATIQIDMTSVDFDAIIGLFEGNGIFIAEDDNSGGNGNARMVRQLTAGTYRIWANATLGGATGAYTLVVSQR